MKVFALVLFLVQCGIVGLLALFTVRLYQDKVRVQSVPKALGFLRSRAFLKVLFPVVLLGVAANTAAFGWAILVGRGV